MNRPNPPTISPSALITSLQLDNIGRNSCANGYISGVSSLTINGQDQTYSAASVAGGLIMRSDTTVAPCSDILPSPSALATELRLPCVIGTSYTRTFALYNQTNYYIELNADGWTFPGTNRIYAYNAVTFVYNISYTLDGWAVVCLSSGLINLD